MSPAVPTVPVLTLAALNRATLARQHLLERAPLDPVAAAGLLGGLQAQEPASPYLALRARLADLDPAAVSAAFTGRHLVKAGLMRATLHVVPADDYLLLRPAVEPVFAVSSRLMRGARPDPARLARLRAEVEALAATPRPASELRDRLASLEGIEDTERREALWWWVRRTTPLIQAPTGGPWSFGRRPSLVAPGAWLGRPFAPAAEGLVHLVRRYLGAFGPATIADAASWSRLPAARLRPAIDELDAAGELWHARDERGRTLLDLVDAPRPDAGTPAPPRLLPMWDSVLLAHADRARLVADADRPRVTAGNGDTYPTFLVDGRVAGVWWARATPTGPEIDLEPFGRLRPEDRRGLEAEAAGVAALLAGREPAAFARYRASRDRKAARRAAATEASGTSG